MKTSQFQFMERFMLHLKNEKYTPKDAFYLLSKSRELCSEFDAIIRDARVSKKFLEFDVSINKGILDQLVNTLKLLGELDHAKQIIEEEKSKETAIKEGINYFNEERFWECHEILEGVWKKCYEGEKDLVQGIILVAAAFVHYQKNENEICLSILGRALEKLSHSTGLYHNIDIDKFRSNVTKVKTSQQVSTFLI